MKTLSIDIETYSDVPLPKTGVYRYCESPDFEILLFGYSVDSGPVQVVDLACGEKIPAEIIVALEDESVIKWAFNASFERICLSRFLGYPTGEYLDSESWRCSMIWAATMGLPLSLEGVGAVLGLEKQKLTEGKDLIKYFCQPCAATKSNGGRTRNRLFHTPEKWEALKRYNIRDVEIEMGIQHKLRKFPVPESVWEEYHIDQEINDRGVHLDMELVQQAIAMDARSREELTATIKDITKLENPNSVLQMKQWLSANGVETDSLDKKAIAKLLKNAPDKLTSVLILRQQLAKSSVRKYQAMEKTVCSDDRARGMFQFYGANRTGRFSGRNIQLQNLPQNHLPDLANARALVRSGNFDAVSLLYEDVPDTLSQLIRTAFIPREGTQFLVADFSAIEARVIAWFAGEEWRQKVFAKGGDIYCASASQMFKVPVEKHGINGHLRQKGKIAELALGYGGSVGALKAMGAMEILRNNSLQDDGTDTVKGVDWFQYKGKIASTLYVSGNSWIGFGENTEQLKIVRRDTDLMTLRREEGTIWGTYKFLRIRWEGYSVHGNRNEATRMVWDAILFDTGEICVSFDTIPTNSSYLADSSLVTGDGTISFTALTGKIISFKPKDESGNSFEYVDHAPVFLDPYNRRYLISDADGALYTVEENALVKLEETELTAELFETRGVQDIPDGKLLITLHDPTILYWHDSENLFPDMKVSYTGVPIPQVLYSENIDMSDFTILGIEKVTADCSDEVLFAVSFDDGASWWSCINAVWAKLSEEKSGMSKAALEAISVDSWAEKATTGQLKYRFIISGADGYLKSITTDYLNTEE